MKNIEAFQKNPGNPEDVEGLLKKMEEYGYFDDPHIKEVISKWYKKMASEQLEELEEVRETVGLIKKDMEGQKKNIKELKENIKIKKGLELIQTERELINQEERVKNSEKFVREIGNNILKRTKFN